MPTSKPLEKQITIKITATFGSEFLLGKKPPENGGNDEDGQNTRAAWTFWRRSEVPVVRYLPAG